MILDLILKLSQSEQKSLLERMVKLQEETGELAEEVLIAQRSSGSQHKRGRKTGIQEEAADVILVVLSIFFHSGGTIDKLKKLLNKKARKWSKRQLKK